MSWDIPFRAAPGVNPGAVKAGSEFLTPDWYVAVKDAVNVGEGALSDCWQVEVVSMHTVRPMMRSLWVRLSPHLSQYWRGVLARWTLVEHSINWPKWPRKTT